MKSTARFAVATLLFFPALAGAARTPRLNPRVTLAAERHGGDIVIRVGISDRAAFENGAAMALCFASSEGQLIDTGALETHGLLAAPGVEPDLSDLDGDAATDSLVRLAWLDISGAWGAGASAVGTLRFTAPAGLTVRAVPLSHEPRYRFVPVRLRLSEGRRQATPERQGAEPVVAGIPRTLKFDARTSIFAPPAKAAATCNLDPDRNLSGDALTDGVLVLRFLAGFSGNFLTSGALGSGATRTAPDDIARFLGASTCFEMLDADGNGEADQLTDGILLARYLLGFTGDLLVVGAVAPDALRTDPVAIKQWLDFYRFTGAVLQIAAPQLTSPLLSGIEARFSATVRYTGTLTLRYSLNAAPAGATIDAASGVIRYTPPRSAEGQRLDFTIGVTDGELLVSNTYGILIAASTPIAANAGGNTMTITQPGNLAGTEIGFGGSVEDPAGAPIAPGGLAPSVLPPASVDPIPDGVTRITDIFRTVPAKATTAPIRITLPTGTLPAGRQPQDLRVYHFGTETTLPSKDPEWTSSQLGVTIPAAGQVRFDVYTLGEPMFLGLPPASETAAAAPVHAAGAPRASATAATCTPISFFLFGADPRHQLCTLPDGFTVTIRNFQTNRWTGGTATVADLADWVAQSRAVTQARGMRMDNAIEVLLEDLTKDNAFGYESRSEGYKLLHLTNTANTGGTPNTLALMQATVAHELFHHTHARETADPEKPLQPGPQSLILNDEADWVTEGMALWWEDEVWDDSDAYRIYNGMPQVLTAGLHPYPNSKRDQRTNPYQRFAFWKMMAGVCGGAAFPARNFLFGNLETDPAGSNNWENQLTPCNFGQGFGPGIATGMPATALLRYQYGSVRRDRISIFDANEDDERFTFAEDADSEIVEAAVPGGSDGPRGIPAHGAHVYRVFAKNDVEVPRGKEAFVRFSVSGGSAWISIGSPFASFTADPDFLPISTVPIAGAGFDFHVHKNVGGSATMTYGQRDPQDEDLMDLPELFITVVNGGSGPISALTVTTGVRDPLGQLTITSPSAGSSHSLRVIPVAGTIAPEVAASVARVVIKQPTISAGSGSAENSADISGSGFSGSAVIALGDNTISVVGVDSAGNEVTEETSVSFTGVAGGSGANALIPSAMVFVLNWNTATDVDGYVTGPPGTLWYQNTRIEGFGQQDTDDTSGYGPEVFSWFASMPSAPGFYDFDAHYYSGSPATNYTVDVLLNETNPALRVGYRRVGPTALTGADGSSNNDPGSGGPSWGTNVIVVRCDAGTGASRNCSLAQ